MGIPVKKPPIETVSILENSVIPLTFMNNEAFVNIPGLIDSNDNISHLEESKSPHQREFNRIFRSLTDRRIENHSQSVLKRLNTLKVSIIENVAMSARFHNSSNPIQHIEMNKSVNTLINSKNIKNEVTEITEEEEKKV